MSTIRRKKSVKTYPKMKTLYKLKKVEGSRKWDCTSGEILPETAALHFFPIEDLIFTEKIDGTNMGIEALNGKIKQILKRNSACKESDPNDHFYIEKAEELRRSIERTAGFENLHHVTFFGELCGTKIQKGGNYFPERRFLCFDIYDHKAKCFFRWQAIEHFCRELWIETTPVVEYQFKDLSIKNVENFLSGFHSTFNEKHFAEGIVVRHKDDTSTGNRYMAKIRRKDFGL